MKKDKDIVGLMAFFAIVALISFVYGMGMFMGIMMVSGDNEFLTEKTQEQFWEIRDLQQEIAYCEYHRGNEQSIILSSSRVPTRQK